MNKLVRREHDGIDFYVSLDGEQIGMSLRGLAKFSGVPVSTLQELISKAVSGNISSDYLKSLLGKDLTPTGTDKNLLVLLMTAEECVAVIQYFAIVKNSEKARFALGKFASLGFKSWVLKVTNHQTVKPLSRVESLKALREDLDKLIRIEQYSDNKPGMTNILEYAKDEENENVLPGLITIDDVLNRLRLKVSLENKKVIGMYASTAYRNLTGKKPPEITRKYQNLETGKWKSHKVAAYPLDFVPIIENAINLGFGS